MKPESIAWMSLCE